MLSLQPTILDFAGVIKPKFMDGFSIRPWLWKTEDGDDATGSSNGTMVDNRDTATANWRTSWLVEYLSVGTYYNDHSNAWQVRRLVAWLGVFFKMFSTIFLHVSHALHASLFLAGRQKHH
jgi:hypothetical protein